MTGPELLASRRITLLGNGVRVPPNDASADRIREAVEAHNRSARLDGQPDELNPITLDPARVLAFVEGMPRLPEAVLQRLEGRFVVLGAEDLLLSTSSPVSAAAIERGYTLSLPEEEGAVVQAALHADVGREEAEAIAAKAEQAARAADAELGKLGELGAAPAAVTNARWRRFAAAKVWEIAAKAVCEVAPRDRAANKRWKEASRAVKAWVAPPWVGMRR